MSREVTLGSRKFYIVSEPDAQGWKALVLEVLDGQDGTHDTGIEATGDTRTSADERALGLLQQRLRDEP